MYFQRDYVLRMIEMMGDFVRRICSLAREADAMDELDEAARRGCGMSLDMLAAADAETLRALLGEAQRFFAAELLLLRADVSAKTRPEESLTPLREQALRLLCGLCEPDYLPRACDHAEHTLAAHLSALSPAALEDAAALCERGGRYAAAEDALFAARDLDDRFGASIARLYDRLEALDDAALRAGGLTRAEIAEGRAELHNAAL